MKIKYPVIQVELYQMNISFVRFAQIKVVYQSLFSVAYGTLN